MSRLLSLRPLLKLQPFFKPITLPLRNVQSAQSSKLQQLNPVKFNEVNTNVAKDVLLFKYENPRFFKTLSIFAVGQFLFWNYLSHFAFTTLKDAPIDRQDEDVSWWRKINLGENKYRNSLTIFCFLVGKIILIY